MRIVVDTNIVFSAILNTDSKIAQILLKPKSKMNFYSTERLKYEINQHKDKIQTLGDYSDSELNRLIYITTKKIKFINVNLIPIKIYKIANKLTNDIDLDDSEFIALTDHIKGNLWSGDKKLIKGLKLKNWTNVISTNELYRLL